jgi:O-antigen ligase
MYYLQIFSVTAITLFYPLTLTVNRTAGIIQSLLVLIGLIAIFVARKNKEHDVKFMQLVKDYWPLHLTMAAPLIAVILNALFTGNVHGRDFEYPLRLALFPFIFWAVFIIPLDYRHAVQYGFIAASILAVTKMIILTDNGAVRYGTDFIPIIIFGLWALLTGLFSVYSLFWGTKQNRFILALILLALSSGIYTAYLSRARGVWLAIPILLLIMLATLKKVTVKQKILGLFILATVSSGLWHSSDMIQERFSAAASDLRNYATQQNADTSVGTRLQLWNGSFILFKEHPMFGVGVTGFKPAIKDLAERKIISEQSTVHPHSHNEILFMMAQLGIFGLIAVLALYIVPGWYFIMLVRNTDLQTRMLAGSGLSLCAGFMILGFTDVVFMWREAFPFYAISIALFLTSIIRRRQCLLADQTCAYNK